LEKGGGHVIPEKDKFAIVGHSVGGLLTANVAALAHKNGLPVPKAVMSVEPGKTWSRMERARVDLVDLSAIPGSTLLLTVSGEEDGVVNDADAKKIFKETPQITGSNKNYIVFQSDSYGSPELKADHMFPVGAGSLIVKSGDQTGLDSPNDGGRRGERLAKLRAAEITAEEQNDLPDVQSGLSVVNAYDYNGIWKLFDGLTDAAFYGKNREYALGDTPEQKSLGEWGDGTPIKQLIIYTSVK
jgi:hypothetical protein